MCLSDMGELRGGSQQPIGLPNNKIPEHPTTLQRFSNSISPTHSSSSCRVWLMMFSFHSRSFFFTLVRETAQVRGAEHGERALECIDAPCMYTVLVRHALKFTNPLSRSRTQLVAFALRHGLQAPSVGKRLRTSLDRGYSL